MQFISIHLSANPTAEELRKAREIMALMRQLSDNKDTRDTSDEDDTPRAAAPAAPAPPAPPAPPGDPAVFQASVGAAVETLRDKTNLPWDERIHSSAKSVNQDGTWKKRKGVGDSFVQQVVSELRAVPGNAAPVAAAPAAPAAPPAPPAPPAPAAPAPAAAVPAAGDNPFVAMMKLAGPKLAAKTLTNEQMVEACKSVGLDSLPALAQRHDLVPTVSAILGLV